jgi:hypothetical protein
MCASMYIHMHMLVCTSASDAKVIRQQINWDVYIKRQQQEHVATNTLPRPGEIQTKLGLFISAEGQIHLKHFQNLDRLSR